MTPLAWLEELRKLLFWVVNSTLRKEDELEGVNLGL